MLCDPVSRKCSFIRDERLAGYLGERMAEKPVELLERVGAGDGI
jgi:hypothetical protein